MPEAFQIMDGKLMVTQNLSGCRINYINNDLPMYLAKVCSCLIRCMFAKNWILRYTVTFLCLLADILFKCSFADRSYDARVFIESSVCANLINKDNKC